MTARSSIQPEFASRRNSSFCGSSFYSRVYPLENPDLEKAADIDWEWTVLTEEVAEYRKGHNERSKPHLRAAGVSGDPLQALQAATINSAELMRMEDRLGTIEAGKVGDVLILDANPLEDIRNTRKIAQVISRGQLLDGLYHADFRNPIPENAPYDSRLFFPSPRIQWASPEAILEGAQNVALAVHGTGFIPYSSLRFNGQPLKTTFVDEFQLTAQVPPNLLEPGTYAITVENPDFGWGTIYALGASDLAHLGIRDYISNEFLVLVKPQGGAPIFPHPREAAAN